MFKLIKYNIDDVIKNKLIIKLEIVSFIIVKWNGFLNRVLIFEINLFFFFLIGFLIS